MTSTRRRLIQGAAAGGALALLGRSAIGQSAQINLKWANNLPLTHPSNVRLREVVEGVRKDTGGKVDIQVFPNNQLGGDTDMLSQLRAGAIDIFPISGLILQTLVPLSAISGLAFAFKDYPTVWGAMDGDLGAYIREAIGKFGLHTFDRCLDNGYRNITSSTRPIRTAEDLEGFKIRVPVSPLWTSLFKALGAAPASINFSEVYSALQTKVVEGQENPLAIIEIAKLYEVQKYCSLTGHMWDGQWILANGRRWEALPKEVQGIITRHVTESVMLQREDIRKLNESLEAKLKTHGMLFNKVDTPSFQAALAKAGFYAEWRGKFGDEAMARLEKYSGKLG